MRRLFAALAVCTFAALAPAAPAFAHAQLMSTTPGGNSVLDQSPENIELEFSENVSAGPGAIRVYDSNANRVDESPVSQPDDRHIVTLDLPELDGGGYVVTWRVTSADSHPISGAFSFSVGGEEVDTAGLSERLLSQNGGDPLVGALDTATRSITFGSLLLLVGAVGFLGLVSKSVLERPRFKAIVMATTASLALATVLGFLIHGPYTAGLGLSSIFQPEILKETAKSSFGQASVIRLIFSVVLGATLLAAFKRSSFGLRLAVPAIATALLLLLSVTLTGHAVTGRYVGLAIVADLIHMAAAAVWIGGLVYLFVFGLRNRSQELLSTVTRFSNVAFWSVVALVITGTFQGWRQLGTLSELFALDYGRLLLVKVGLVAAILIVANQSRKWVNKQFTAVDLDEKPELATKIRKRVGIESVVSVLVVVVTALLVNAVPSQAVTGGPQQERLEVANYYVDAVVDPAETGPNAIHFYVLSKQGSVTDVQDLTASLALPSSDIEAIEVPLSKAGPGHMVNYGMAIPIAGEWTLTVDVRVDDFTQETVTTTVNIS
jgi:copper transport protein